MSRAAARGVNASTARASGTLRPRTCSATTRALRADVRTHLAWARTVGMSVVTANLALLHLRLAVAGVAAEQPRRRELAELVPDHLLGHEDRHVLAPVVDGDRVADHLREDRRGARPGADHPLVAGGVHLLDPLHQPLFHERPLLRAATHLATTLLAAAAAADDQLVRFLVLAAGALAERRHAPRGDRVASALRLALAAPVWVVDRVHGRAAHRRALAAPTAAAGLAAGDVLVVEVPDLT